MKVGLGIVFLILMAIFQAQCLWLGSFLILSEALVTTVIVLRFFLNETMAALQCGGPFACTLVTFFEVLSTAPDKPISERGDTFLCTEILPKNLL